jgi:hypothetical protein
MSVSTIVRHDAGHRKLSVQCQQQKSWSLLDHLVVKTKQSSFGSFERCLSAYGRRNFAAASSPIFFPIALPTSVELR